MPLKPDSGQNRQRMRRLRSKIKSYFQLLQDNFGWDELENIYYRNTKRQ